MKFSNNDGQNHIRNNTVYITCMFRSHRYGVALLWRIGFSKEEKNEKSEKSEKSLLFHLQKRKISNYWSQVYVIHFQERICREKIVSHEHLTYRVVRKVERVSIYTFLKCFWGTYCLMYMSKNVTQKPIWYMEPFFISFSFWNNSMLSEVQLIYPK